MSRPQASVVLCTRNRATILPNALETLALQVTGAPFEVVVVDNASEDGTADVIAEWCRRDERFKLVREPRMGLSRAKNTGIENAGGDLILFTDDDVVVDPNWIEAHVRLLTGRTELIMAGGRILPIAHDLGRWPGWLGPTSYRDLPMLDHGDEARPLGRWEQVWGANIAVPRHVFDRVGRWNEDVGRKGDERGTWEDLDFADRVRKAGGEVWFCPGATIHHRVSPQRASPGPMLRAAFLRGLDDYVRAVWASDEPAGAALSLAAGIRATVALAVHLGGWMFGSLVFRIFRQRAAFEATRDAAWSAGQRMMELTLRRSPGADVPVEPPNLFNYGNPIARAIMRVCFFSRRVAVRLAPAR